MISKHVPVFRIPSAAYFGSRRIVNFYSTLGVERNASMEEIRAAYLRLAKKYHPDVNKAGENTRQRFDNIKMAYEALSVEKNRDLYDVYMDSDPYEWKNQEFERFYDTSRQFSRKGTKYDRKYNKSGNFWGDGEGETGRRDKFEEEAFRNFEQFFRGGRQTPGGAHEWRNQGKPKGENVFVSGEMVTQVEIEIDFMDTVKGATKGMKIPDKLVICESCKGTTAKPDTDFETCTYCNAFGYTITNYGSRKKCQNCRGTGSVAKEHCEKCTGHGVVAQESIQRISIPVGVEEGQNLRVSKRGHASRTGINGEAGDLIVKLKIRPHPYFMKEGQNIVSNLDVPLADAVLGSEMKVRTIEGAQTIQIPAGTLPQDTITLNGLGFQYGGEKSQKSAQIFKINLIYPQIQTTEEARRILQELAQLEQEVNEYDPTAPKARDCYYLRPGEEPHKEREATRGGRSERKNGMFSSFKNWFQ